MRVMDAASDRLCEEAAARQHGVLAREAALAFGVSERGIDLRLESGRWRAAAPGVYLPRPVPITWTTEVMATVLGGGRGALASHRTAARLSGLIDVRPPRIEIVARRSHGWPGVTVHRLRPSDRPLAAAVGSIPVTTVPRTLLDLAGVVPPRVLGHALDSAVRSGATYELVARELATTGGRGRRGTVRLREALERRDPSGPVAESPLESEVIDLILDAGLPRPVLQHVVVDGTEIVARLDLAYPGQRIGIEVHGYRFHSPYERWDLDQQRENRLKLLGWTVLVFSWEAVKRRPETVIATIRAALAGKFSPGPTSHVGR